MTPILTYALQSIGKAMWSLRLSPVSLSIFSEPAVHQPFPGL